VAVTRDTDTSEQIPPAGCDVSSSLWRERDFLNVLRDLRANQSRFTSQHRAETLETRLDKLPHVPQLQPNLARIAARQFLGELLRSFRYSESTMPCTPTRSSACSLLVSLGDEDHADAGKLELLEDPERIDEFATEPACVVDEDHAERWRLFLRAHEQSSQAFAIVRCSGDCFVRVDVPIQYAETVTLGVFATLADLLIDGERVLQLAGVAGVDGTARSFGHGLTVLSSGAAVLLWQSVPHRNRFSQVGSQDH
jgi:hypothetical protein